MFPNVRLLIAAIIASVVALTCGFAIFAAFRVNHEPLARLPPGAAPLRLAAERAATLSVSATEPFEHRFPAAEAAGSTGTALAFSAIEPPQQATKAGAQASDGGAPAAPAPAAPTERVTPAADSAPASAFPQEDVVLNSAVTVEEAPRDAAAAATEPAAASIAPVAAIEPQSEPPDQRASVPAEAAVTPMSAPPEATLPVPDTAATPAAKKTERTPAGKKHRGRAVAAGVIAGTNPQNWSYLEPHFLTAPPPYPPPQQVVIRRHRVASSKPANGNASAATPPAAPAVPAAR